MIRHIWSFLVFSFPLYINYVQLISVSIPIWWDQSSSSLINFCRDDKHCIYLNAAYAGRVANIATCHPQFNSLQAPIKLVSTNTVIPLVAALAQCRHAGPAGHPLRVCSCETSKFKFAITITLCGHNDEKFLQKFLQTLKVRPSNMPNAFPLRALSSNAAWDKMPNAKRSRRGKTSAVKPESVPTFRVRSLCAVGYLRSLHTYSINLGKLS